MKTNEFLIMNTAKLYHVDWGYSINVWTGVEEIKSTKERFQWIEWGNETTKKGYLNKKRIKVILKCIESYFGKESHSFQEWENALKKVVC